MVTPKIYLLIQSPCGLVNPQQGAASNIGGHCGLWVTQRRGQNHPK
jgi:hypothetical protein